MCKSSYKVLGVMSGTSLDGIDLSIADYRCSSSGHWSCDFVYATTEPYSSYWKRRLEGGHALGSADLQKLDQDYTRYLGGEIARVVARHKDQTLDLVCSHGHTILHQPEQGVTLQIGNRPELRELVGLPVVCDFRVQDVRLGGQGAPLVPIGDRLLFGMYESCLNIGGFANCSFEQGEVRTAFDICPVNIVLNRLAEKEGRPYDSEGAIARTGSIDHDLLQQLNSLLYYASQPPKSLGLEWVIQQIDPILDRFNKVSNKNLLRTFTEHIAVQIASQLPEGQCLVTGGGANNLFLIERLSKLSDARINVPESWLVDNKEALIFGLLGVLKHRGEVNCLSSVTGASKDHSSGVVYP